MKLYCIFYFHGSSGRTRLRPISCSGCLCCGSSRLLNERIVGHYYNMFHWTWNETCSSQVLEHYALDFYKGFFSLSVKNLKTILEYQKLKTSIMLIDISAVHCSHHHYWHRILFMAHQSKEKSLRISLGRKWVVGGYFQIIMGMHKNLKENFSIYNAMSYLNSLRKTYLNFI